MTELIIRYVKMGLLFVLLWVGMGLYGMYGCHKVKGLEMDPTVKKDSFHLVKIQHDPSSLAAGDIVLFDHFEAGYPQDTFVARILGMPGDRVRIAKGQIFLNDATVDAGYVAAGYRSYEEMPEIVVPMDSFFLVCDNRRGYLYRDSRTIGPVHYWAVRGKIN